MIELHVTMFCISLSLFSNVSIITMYCFSNKNKFVIKTCEGGNWGPWEEELFGDVLRNFSE